MVVYVCNQCTRYTGIPQCGAGNECVRALLFIFIIYLNYFTCLLLLLIQILNNTKKNSFDWTGRDTASVAAPGPPHLITKLQTESTDLTNYSMCLLHIFLKGLNGIFVVIATCKKLMMVSSLIFYS